MDEIDKQLSEREIYINECNRLYENMISDGAIIDDATKSRMRDYTETSKFMYVCQQNALENANVDVTSLPLQPSDARWQDFRRMEQLYKAKFARTIKKTELIPDGLNLRQQFAYVAEMNESDILAVMDDLSLPKALRNYAEMINDASTPANFEKIVNQAYGKPPETKAVLTGQINPLAGLSTEELRALAAGEAEIIDVEDA